MNGCDNPTQAERPPRVTGARKARDRRLRKSGQMIYLPEWVHDVIRNLSDETGTPISTLSSEVLEEWVRSQHPGRVPEDLRS